MQTTSLILAALTFTVLGYAFWILFQYTSVGYEAHKASGIYSSTTLKSFGRQHGSDRTSATSGSTGPYGSIESRGSTGSPE